jgi:hypothetical protein
MFLQCPQCLSKLIALKMALRSMPRVEGVCARPITITIREGLRERLYTHVARVEGDLEVRHGDAARPSAVDRLELFAELLQLRWDGMGR